MNTHKHGCLLSQPKVYPQMVRLRPIIRIEKPFVDRMSTIFCQAGYRNHLKLLTVTWREWEDEVENILVLKIGLMIKVVVVCS
jgi:hypothetical protein